MKKKSILETLNEIKDISNSKFQKIQEIDVISKEVAKLDVQRKYREKIVLDILNPIVKELVDGLNIIPERLLKYIDGSFYQDQIIYYFHNLGGYSVEVRCPIEHINDYLLSKKLYQLVFSEHTRLGAKVYHLIPLDDSEQYFKEIYV